MVILDLVLGYFYLCIDFVLIQTVTWTGQGDHSPLPNFVPSHIGETAFPKMNGLIINESEKAAIFIRLTVVHAWASSVMLRLSDQCIIDTAD